LESGQYLFPSRLHDESHISTRQYARIVNRWVDRAGVDGSAYWTHSMRRTHAAQIYKKTGNLRAVQLLLGHMKLERTVRYLGIEVDDALSSPSRSNSDCQHDAALPLTGPQQARGRTVGTAAEERADSGPSFARHCAAGFDRRRPCDIVRGLNSAG
jgi:hypothetical protein